MKALLSWLIGIALPIAILLSIPLWGTLLPWAYNKRDPMIFDVPFFYWYQLMWIPLSVSRQWPWV